MTTVGVLGGGQLGLMLGQAAQALGVACVFLEPAEECPAAAAGAWIRAPFDDPGALQELAGRCDLVTYEFENVPVEAVRALAVRRPVRPSAVSLEIGQDRLHEKELFLRLEIPTPRWDPLASGADPAAALAQVGLPALLKTRRMGYDGRGQRLLREPAELAPARAALGGGPFLIEEYVPFERELSVIVVRAADGAMACYPPVENHHREGILRLSRAPAPGLSPTQQARAEDYGRRVAQALDHVGVLALELFQRGADLLANELAPRVHNTGHWTIEGAEASQFENHLRAIADLPLGETAARGRCAMVNLIGEVPDLAATAGTPECFVHLYGKRPRPGRKLGHITLQADDPEQLESRLAALWALTGGGGLPPAGASRPGQAPARA